MKNFSILAFVIGCLLPANTRAMDLKQSKFTQVVNSVVIFSTASHASHPVAVNDLFKIPDTLRTGPNSRAELAAADGTITRVGANTIFPMTRKTARLICSRAVCFSILRTARAAAQSAPARPRRP